jgi:hypothetical protein
MAACGVSLAAETTPTRIIHTGGLAESALTWQQDSEGKWRPALVGTRTLRETGKPLLVRHSLNILIPPDLTGGEIEVVPLRTHRIRLPGSLAVGELVTSSDGHQVVRDRLTATATAYPSIWGESGGSQVWRGFRLATVSLYPLRVHREPGGQWNELEILDRYEIRIRPGSVSTAQSVAQRNRRVPGERRRCEEFLRDLVVNPEGLGGYPRADGQAIAQPTGGFEPALTPSLTGSAVSYLIITNEELASEFQVLADHYTDLGLPTAVANVESITASYRNGADIQETIRMFIREAYENWGTEFVLLGGDTEILAPRYVTNTYHPPTGTTDIPADLYFACLDGNWNADGDYIYGEPYTHYLNPGDEVDLADEVFLGRAPVNSKAQAAVFVDKVISYSRAPSGSQWTGRQVFAAEVLFPQPWNPGDPVALDGAALTEGLVYNYLDPCTEMAYTRMYENWEAYPASVPLNRAALIDSLNTGHYGIVNQIGHGFFFNMHVGDANFTVSDADALTNTDHWFLIYALNCASGAFDKSCLLERFLQNPQGGAVVSIGSSRAAFPYTANDYQENFFDSLFCQQGISVGQAISISRLPFLAYTFFNSVDRWTFLTYSLLGDPALQVWTGPVAPVQVDAPVNLVAGTQQVEISVSQAGTPVPSARVCLHKSGDAYSYGFSAADGQVVLPFTPTSAGEAFLTVTGENIEFTRRAVPVTVGMSYVAVTDLQVVDDGSVGSVGNGNGVAEAGEVVAVYLVCQDTGGGGAGDCEATLAMAGDGLTVVDGHAQLGDVPPGGSLTAADPFLVAIDADIHDGFYTDMFFVVTDDAGSSFETVWRQTFLASEVEPVELVWSDVEFGNGNGTREDNERITVSVILKNFGAGQADHITGVLRTLDPQLTLHDSVVTYTDITFLSRDGGDATFSLADGNVDTDGWSWILFTNEHGHTFRHDFRLRPLAAPYQVAGVTSLAPDVIMLRWPPVQEDGVRGYNVYRSETETGPFSRVNNDLIDGVSYFRDSGLHLMTPYYYQIATVDSSLVEGERSPTHVQNTSPPELGGFPLPFALESSGHCAVGDIDGDGGLDVIVGSDEVYAWRADGSELFDGDDDPQTHGPITDLAGNFQPAGIVLAQLDDHPGLEIVASNGEGFEEIHLLRGDGSALPGWPKSLASPSVSWNWATPAVGDVDGVVGLEVVVNTLNGHTWVWHVDGTELRDGDANPATDGVFLVRTNAEWEWGISSPALFDLDGDGACEIIFGSKLGGGQENFLHAYRYDGDQASGFPYSVGAGPINCSPTVADLNLDGIWEVIFQSQNDLLHVVQQDGSPYPGFPISFVSNNGGVISTPSPAVGDFDLDGQLEIVALSTESPQAVHLYVFDTDSDGGSAGQPLAGWPVTLPGSSEASPVVGDIDADGVPDILHGIGGGHEESPDILYAFDAGGESLDGFPIGLGGPLRASQFICDLDRDGDVDIVGCGWDRLIHVWDLPATYEQTKVPWPTFRGHALRDGVYRPVDPVGTPTALPRATLFVSRPFPNPFNPSTSVRLFLPVGSSGSRELEVVVYDLQGRRIRTLHQGPATEGWHTFTWDGRDGRGHTQASGLYFLRARSGDQAVLRKLTLIK